MKKIILSIVALIILVVGIMVFCVVRSFNVENYKTQVITSLSQMMGKKLEEVSINGEASLSWRPMPTFVMNDLVVANQEAKTDPMIKISQVQVEIEWRSLFKSPLMIKKIILKKPEILVERRYSYQTNFSFPILFNPGRSVDQDALMSASDDFLVQIDTLEVEDGVLHWKNLLKMEEYIHLR